MKLDRDAGTGISRRGAFVEMRTAADAQKAINGLNFADFDGRLMSVYRARRSRGRSLSSNVARSPNMCAR